MTTNGTHPIVGAHPLAEEWPIRDDVLAEVSESIAANGLRHPIVITPDGLIIDGRTRYKACLDVGVTPAVEVYEGSDILEYIIDANAGRRHESTAVRAMIVARMLVKDGRRRNGRWKRGSVDIGGTPNSESNWQYVLKQCGVVLDFKPDLAESVVNGGISLNEAFTRADDIRKSADRDKIVAREKAKREKNEAAAEAERNAQIVADLTEAGAQNYLDLTEDNTMTPKAAWAAHREDTRKARERAELERQGRSDMYTGIGQGLLCLGGYGLYEDIPKLMAEYAPAELNPPQLDRYFEIENLEDAARFVSELIEWRKTR